MTKGRTPPALEWMLRLGKLDREERLLSLRIVDDLAPVRFVVRLGEVRRLVVSAALINDWPIATIERYLAAADAREDHVDWLALFKEGLAEVARTHA